MDLSKLPKLSETPPQPPVAPEQDQIPPAPMAASRPHVPDVPMSIGAEVWVSLVIGLIFLMVGWNFARYIIAAATGQTYHTGIEWQTGDRIGTEVTYPELQTIGPTGKTVLTIWNDSAMFVFGVVLVLEAVVLVVAAGSSKLKHPLIGLAALIAAIATLFNLIVAGKMFGAGIMPLTSLLAVAFGGYMAAYQWKMFQATRPRPAR